MKTKLLIIFRNLFFILFLISFLLFCYYVLADLETNRPYKFNNRDMTADKETFDFNFIDGATGEIITIKECK